ncbi:MAG: hypothetical protein AAB783_01290 [Patescibacteria group bacterium]
MKVYFLKKGQSLFEAIIAIAIFALSAAALIVVVLGGGSGVLSASLEAQGSALADEGIEAVRSIHDGPWNEFQYAQSRIAVSGGQWIFDGVATPEVIGEFTRTITISDVCRDASNAIAICPALYTDPHTKNVAVTVLWQARPGVARSVKRSSYITNWDSRDLLEDTVADFADGTFTNTQTHATQGDGNGSVMFTLGGGLLVYARTSDTTPRWRTYIDETNSFSVYTGSIVGGVGRTFSLRTSPIKKEAIAGYVDSAGTLRVICFDGTTWSNEWNDAVGGGGTTRRFDISYETSTGDAMIVYATGNATTNELKYRTKLGSVGCGSGSWSGSTFINPIRTSGVVQWVRTEGDPRASSQRIALAWGDGNRDLSAMIWDGTAWGSEPASALETNLESVSTTAGTLDALSFDIAFESVSGNIMAVWGVLTRGTACVAGSTCMRYARHTGSWLGAVSVPTIADSSTSIDIASHPTTNEIIMVAMDDGNNSANANDLSAAYWNGSAWTSSANLDITTATPVANGKHVAAGWLKEGATSRGIVLYNDASATNISWYVWNGAGFALQADFNPTPSFTSPHRWYDIQTDPFNLGRLMFTIADSAEDLHAKRLVMTSFPAFTWSNADGGAVLENSLARSTGGGFVFAYWRALATSGTYISNALQILGARALQAIEWSESKTSPTCILCSISVEVRSAASSAALTGASWDATIFTSHFGQFLGTAHNGNTWFQYRATLVGDGVSSPVLEKFRVNYK